MNFTKRIMIEGLSFAVVALMVGCSFTNKPKLLNDPDNASQYTDSNGVLAFAPDAVFGAGFMVDLRNINTNTLYSVEMNPSLRKITFRGTSFMGRSNVSVTEVPVISKKVALYELPEGDYVAERVSIHNQSLSNKLDVQGDTIRIRQNTMTVLGHPILNYGLYGDAGSIATSLVSDGSLCDCDIKSIDNEKIRSLDKLNESVELGNSVYMQNGEGKGSAILSMALLNEDSLYADNVSSKDLAELVSSIQKFVTADLSACKSHELLVATILLTSDSDVLMKVTSKNGRCPAEVQELINDVSALKF